MKVNSRLALFVVAISVVLLSLLLLLFEWPRRPTGRANHKRSMVSQESALSGHVPLEASRSPIGESDQTGLLAGSGDRHYAENATLNTDGFLNVTVLIEGPEDKVVAGAKVRLFGTKWGRSARAMDGYGVTNESGQCTVSVRLHQPYRGFISAREGCAVFEWDGEEADVIVRLRGPTASIRIVDTMGTPVPGAIVQLWASGEGRSGIRFEVVTDSGGTSLVPAVGGIVKVTAFHPERGEAEEWLDCLDRGATAVLGLKGLGVVTGQVIDGDTTDPISMAMVAYTSAAPVQCDSAGRFTIRVDRNPGQKCALFAYANGYVGNPIVTVVAQEPPSEVQVFALRRNGLALISITDDSGAPVTEAVVIARRRGDRSERRLKWNGGEAQCDVGEAGETVGIIIETKACGVHRADVTLGTQTSPSIATVALQRGTRCRIVASDWRGDPVSGLVVRLFSADMPQEQITSVRTDQNGGAEVMLCRGQWRLEASHPELPRREVTMNVGSEEENVVLRYGEVVEIRGRVSDSEGRPASYAGVIAYSDGRYLGQSVTNGNGGFRGVFADRNSESVHLVCRPPGWSEQAEAQWRPGDLSVVLRPKR